MASRKQLCFMPGRLPAKTDGGLGSLVIPLSHRDAKSMRSYCGANHAKGLLPTCLRWSICPLSLRTDLSMFFVVEMLWSLKYGAYRTQQ